MKIVRRLVLALWATALPVFAHAQTQAVPTPIAPPEINLNQEGRLRTFAQSPALDCGPLIEAYLDDTGPAASDERRSGRILAGDYSVNTTITWPQLAGGALIGSSAETDLYGTSQTGLESTVTKLTWRGAGSTGPMFTIMGTGMKISDMNLQGLSGATQGAIIADLANRATTAILIEDRETAPEPPYGPGKLHFDVLQIQAFDTAIQLGELITGNQADEINGDRLIVTYCGTALKTLNQQSVNNTILLTHCYGVETILDFTAGGRFNLNSVYAGAAGAVDDTVVVRVPTGSAISPNSNEVNIDVLNFDGSMVEGRLLVMDEAESVRVNVGVWDCTIIYAPPNPNVLRGDARVRIGHWENLVDQSFECHESGGKCPIIEISSFSPLTGEVATNLIRNTSTGTCYVVFRGGAVSSTVGPVDVIQKWTAGVLIWTHAGAWQDTPDFTGDMAIGPRLTPGGYLGVELTINAVAPQLLMYESDAATDTKAWDFFGMDGMLKLRTINDAATAAGDIFTVTRSGVTPGTIAFGTPMTLNVAASDPGTPADGTLYYKSDTDVVRLRANGAWTTLAAAGGSTVGADVIWDAAGDLAVGSGADSASRLAMGTALQVLRVNAGGTGLEWGTGGSGAPTDATYITQTANGSLSNEQAMGLLATGLVKNTVTTGVQSIAVAGTDYVAPDAELTALAGVTSAADKLAYFTGSGTAAVIDLSGEARVILNGATSTELIDLFATETGTGDPVFSTSPTFVTPILGTPASGTLTNCTIPVGGVTGLGTGVGTWLVTPSSANLAAAVTGETGTGALVFGTDPTITDGVTITGSVETTNDPALSITQEWDNVAVAFTAIKLNVTDSTSDAASLLLDLQRDASSRFAVTRTGAVNFVDNIRQTFNPGATVSGLNVGSQAGDPSTPTNGDVWYDSTANEFTARINGANVALGAGGGAPTDAAYIVASANGTLSAEVVVGTGVSTALAANANATGGVATTDGTATITNKRINPRVQSVSSAATVTPAGDSDDQVVVTAQAEALTMAAPTGTPVNGQKLIVRLKDNATARAITWNAIYRDCGATPPTTTVLSKTHYVGFIYNSTDTKWDCIAAVVQP